MPSKPPTAPRFDPPPTHAEAHFSGKTDEFLAVEDRLSCVVLATAACKADGCDGGRLCEGVVVSALIDGNATYEQQRLAAWSILTMSERIADNEEAVQKLKAMAVVIQDREAVVIRDRDLSEPLNKKKVH